MVGEAEALGYARFWFETDLPYFFPAMPKRCGLFRKAPWPIRCFFHACGVKLDRAACERYWVEVNKGQDIREDANAFIWRAWLVALGIRQPGDVLTQGGVERAMFEERREKVLAVIEQGRSPLAHLPPAICLVCGEEPIINGRWWADEGLCSACADGER